MKPAPFRYVAARTIEQALALKAEHGDEARFLAGGQSLVPTMNFRLTQPTMLIDINPLTELAGIRNGGADRVRIGALTRYRTLERDPATERTLPLIHEALPLIAHPQIRNRGTIGGNLAHADPASEMPAIVLTLGGRLRAQSVNGERWIDARDFFVGALTTALEPDEMLTEWSFPSRRRAPAPAFSRCRGGAAISPSSAWRASYASMTRESAAKRASVFAMPATVRCLPTRRARRSPARVSAKRRSRQAAALVQGAIDPAGSIHGSKEFQRHLAGVLTKRALTRAKERARHEH